VASDPDAVGMVQEDPQIIYGGLDTRRGVGKQLCKLGHILCLARGSEHVVSKMEFVIVLPVVRS